MKKTLVFVYGSLKRNEYNHGFMTNSNFLGKALTKNKFFMFDVGFPYLVEPELIPEISHLLPSMVLGEVYEIDYPTFRNLDILEGVSYNNPDMGHYIPSSKEVEFCNDEGSIFCRIYIASKSTRESIVDSLETIKQIVVNKNGYLEWTRN